MSRIKEIHARRIWDSRGRPTVEVEVITDSKAQGRGPKRKCMDCGRFI